MACGSASAGLLLIAALAISPAGPAYASPDVDLSPSLCQVTNAAALLTNEAAAIITPPPLDLAPTIWAYQANLQLRLCTPKLLAPADLTGGNSFLPKQDTADPAHADVTNPFVDDPACYAAVPQSITQAGYESIFDFELFTSDWGELGDPAVYHANTAVDVRLYVGATDDPDSPDIDESLRDAWPIQLADDGRSEIRIPVGRNRLVYRADTLVSPIDFAFIYIPSLPTTSRGFRELAKKSRPFQRAIVRAFQSVSNLDFIFTAGGAIAIDQAIALNFRHSQLGMIDDIYKEAYQDVWVLDTISPVISTATNVSALSAQSQALLSYDAAGDVFYMEAIHAGGILARTATQVMEPLLSYSDHCGRPVRLGNNNGGSVLWPTGSTIQLEWTASDPGPSNFLGDVNTATLTHTIVVRDTFPPVLLAPPSLVYELPPGQQSISINSLGVPRVFDLADLTPEIANDAMGTEFATGLTEVTWTARDSADNTSVAVQLINVKEAGTNTPPVGIDQQVAVQSFAETEIVLTGSDADFHPSVNRFDPLTFSIVEPPSNGDLLAPLLPYFIDDVRLEASALRFADNPMQRDPVGYCGEADVDDVLSFPLEYPRAPEWIAVDDAGNAAIYDVGSILCNNGSTDFQRRLAVFDADLNLLTSTDLFEEGTPTDVFWDQHAGRLYVSFRGSDTPDHVEIYTVSLDPSTADLRLLARYDLQTGPPEAQTGNPVSVSVDSRGIMYVANADKVAAYRPFAGIALQPGAHAQFDAHTQLLASAWARPSALAYPAIESIANDAQDNLYVGLPDRIVKVAAARYENSAGPVLPGPVLPGAGPPASPWTFTPGETVGWLGYCFSNLTSEYACDTAGQRSLGYSCSEALCGRAGPPDHPPGSTPYSMPGQLNNAKGIAIDPNGVLYVADAGNLRVQRFTADGAYGGEARSTGVGFGFLLGDFGYPTDIEVNSNHFYLLNRDADLLHSFQTTPVTPIDDASARVTYRSFNNFIGPDSFVFGVTDGFDHDEATVSIAVSRNFRAPEIPDDALVTEAPRILEDTPRSFFLAGTDPDGDLDSLFVVVVIPPRHGTVEVDGLQVTYIPDADFFGTDDFSYQVSDGTDTSEQTGVVFLTIDPVNDAPSLAVESQLQARQGFLLRHAFTVHDPDPDESLTFEIDWGDGTTTREGHFEIDGSPIPPGEVFNDDGTLRDGVSLTGPLLVPGANGQASTAADHAYATAGTYQVTTCVYDQVSTDPATQEKSPTAESLSSCAQTEVTVTLDAEVSVEIEGPVASLAKGAGAQFTVIVRNLPFDMPADDPRFGLLPAAGLDIWNLTLTGEFVPGLALVGVSSADAVCSASGAEFECSIAVLPYTSAVTLSVNSSVADIAPGGAVLGFVVEADWLDAVETTIAAGLVNVEASGAPPVLQEIIPAAAAGEDYAVVRLHGQNFDAGARVLFGARPGNLVDIIDSTSLTVQVPPAPPGVVDVVIVNPDGQRFVLEGGWTYLTMATPPPPEPPPPPPSPPDPPRVPADRQGGVGAVNLLSLGGLFWLLLISIRRSAAG